MEGYNDKTVTNNAARGREGRQRMREGEKGRRVGVLTPASCDRPKTGDKSRKGRQGREEKKKARDGF